MKYVDLFDAFPDLPITNDYCSTSGQYHYTTWEKDVAIPAIVAAGFIVRHGFYTGDGDSFGPLVRVVEVESPEGENILLTYG